MSAEVADQGQPQDQAKEKPSEAAPENGEPSSTAPENGEEVKSKVSEKEEQATPDSTSEVHDVSKPTTCSPLEEKIIRQVEVGRRFVVPFGGMTVAMLNYTHFLQFYFGDRNLPKDKFLQQAVASDDDGCTFVIVAATKAIYLAILAKIPCGDNFPLLLTNDL